jgi:hypothetical protein
MMAIPFLQAHGTKIEKREKYQIFLQNFKIPLAFLKEM